MIITPPQAIGLCQRIITDLHAWPSLLAALQEGGFEDKSAGRIEQVLAQWSLSPELGVLSNVKLPGTSRERMDLVLFESVSVGNSLLTIDTIFELKTNYARQSTEIVKRLAPSGVISAIAQVQRYQQSAHPGAKNGYVLYTITEMPIFPIPAATPRSPGYANGNTPLINGITQLRNEVATNGLNLLGEATGAHVYCALIAV
jgi:hypothetical protein